MFTTKKILFLILILMIYELVRYFIGAFYINWSDINESYIDTFIRNSYIFFEAFDSFIISLIIVKFSKDNAFIKYANRAKLIITITLVKLFMILILNTWNPADRIISNEEWENRFLQNLSIAGIQILIGLIIFYFIKPRIKDQKSEFNGT